MNAREEELIDRVLVLVEKAYLALRSIVPREWLELDLSMAQLKVLIFLLTDGRTRMGALASAMGVTMPTTTSVVDRLVERGLVVREADPEDRRVVVCLLSLAGRQLTERLWRLGQEHLRSMLKRMTVPQLHLVAQAMEAILETAGEPSLATGQGRKS